MDLSVLVNRVRGEYQEMPCLTLTVAEARRFWRLDPAVCQHVLEALVESGFLIRTERGYRRLNSV